MKKSIFFTVTACLFATGAFAQNHNTLWCDKDQKFKPTHNLQLKKVTPEKIELVAKWGGKSGGATLSASNVAITNGTCENCKPVGQIGANNPDEPWTIKRTDPKMPVTLAWATPGTINLCGTGVLKIN